jgi:hypothetical protein
MFLTVVLFALLLLALIVLCVYLFTKSRRARLALRDSNERKQATRW